LVFFQELFTESDDARAGIENDPVISRNHLNTRSVAAVFQRTPMRDRVTASHSPETEGEFALPHLGFTPAALLVVCRCH
jgi:hypothetical protein